MTRILDMPVNPPPRPNRTHLPGVLCGLLFVAACGSSDSSGSGDDADAVIIGDGTSDVPDASDPDGTLDATVDGDTAPTPDADTGPDLTPCDDNRDCLGGEVCRDGLCREACDPGLACEGPLPVCDALLGYCVECLDADDCSDGAICRDRRCVAPSCRTAADCRGGETCRAGECIPIDERICSPNTRRCDGDTLVLCSRDGTAESREPCDDLCVQADGSADCVARICSPGDVGCLDIDTGFLCSDDGTRLDPLPCSSNQSCVEGICVPRVCDPGAVTCEGNAIATCNEEGTATTFDDCGTCEAANGCTCVAGGCTARVCVPGTSRCVGNASQRCAPDGLAFEAPVACGDALCIAGACVSQVCEPGSAECAGDTLLACDDDGLTRISIDCTETDDLCIDGRCLARLCEPGALRCIDDTLVGACDERGANETRTPCEEGTSCNGGRCVSDAFCDPSDPPFCLDNSRFRCNAEGTAFTRIETCDRTETCTPGACRPPSCETATVSCLNGTTGQRLTAPFQVPTGSVVDCSVVGHDGDVRWRIDQTPAVPLGLITDTAARAEVRIIERGEHRLRAVLSRGFPSTTCAEIEFTINGTPGEPAVALVVNWDPQPGTTSYADVDLHLRHPNGCWNVAPWDCHWAARTPTWTTDPAYGNPVLDRDVISLPGPEAIYFPRPQPGIDYSPAVYLYTQTQSSVDATLFLVRDGVLLRSWPVPLTSSASRFWIGPRFRITTGGALEFSGEIATSSTIPTSCPPPAP